MTAIVNTSFVSVLLTGSVYRIETECIKLVKRYLGRPCSVRSSAIHGYKGDLCEDD